MSSWGHKGYCEVWLEGANDWIYRHLLKAAETHGGTRQHHRANSDGLRERALNQAARELLLAQSSDWAFIMKTRTMVEYAVKRTHEHIVRFTELYFMINRGEINEGFLSDLEWRDNIFSFLNFRAYADGGQ